MLRKDIQCSLQPDGTLAPSASGQLGNNVVSVIPSVDGGAFVQVGNAVIAYLNFDFTGTRVVGYTPTTNDPAVLKSLERLFPLF